MSAEPNPSLPVESAKPLLSPPPSYSPGSGAATDPLEHLHPPLTLQQDIQYHQLFTRPPTQVDITSPGLPVAQAVETYVNDDEIKSNDPKLADADLLYDYFRLKAAEPIRMQVLVHGSHTETQVNYTTRINPHNNQREQVRQTRTITVTDFEITVPILPLSSGQPTEVTLYTATGSYPAKWKVRDAEKWKKRNGLPGWADEAITRQLHNAKNPTDPLEPPIAVDQGTDKGASSPGCDKDLEKGLLTLPVGAAQVNQERALRDLCQQYVADQGRLKEIEMKVEVWGWDLERLENAIENCISATGYSSAVAISFNHTPRRYIVRPFNRLTQLKRNVWLMILACITLVYPVIWLSLRVTGKNGKKYNTIRADHALKTYLPVPDTFPGENTTQACARLHLDPDPSSPYQGWAHRDLVTGPLGVYALAGQKEGAWMHIWEAKIADAAKSRYRGDLSETTGVGASVIGNGLDGY